MDVNVDKTRLLRLDSEVRAPHHVPRRCIMSMKAKKRIKVLFSALFFTTALVALAIVLPIKTIASSISVWIDAHRTWGAVLLPMMFCIAIPTAIPATMIEVLSGSVFGLLEGSILNTLGKGLGSLTAYLIGKRLGKERIGTYLHTKFPMFTALSSVLDGPNWKPLLLIQLSSLPPVIKCYGISITNVSVGRFAATSLVGGIPNAILWAYIGSQTRDLMSTSLPISQDMSSAASVSSGSRWAMLVLGLVCTLLAMGFLFVYTRRALNAQLQEVRQKKDEDLQSMSDAEAEDTETDESVALMDDLCEVVVTQVASLDSPQHVAKRTSIN